MKRFLCMLVLAVLAVLPAIPQTQITWITIPDISGTSSPVALASSGTALFCQLLAPSANSNAVLWGDSNISTSRGSQIAPGGGQFIPPGMATGQSGGLTHYFFNLATTYVLVQSGDKLSATCAIQGIAVAIIPTSLMCNPATLSAGQSALCTVTLSQNSVGLSTLPLTSNSPDLGIPGDLVVIPGRNSGSFTATAAATIPINETVAVSATLNKITVSASLTLLAS